MDQGKLDKAIKLKNLTQIQYQCISSSGLLNSQTRARAWPILLGMQSNFFQNWSQASSECKDSQIIKRDINRSLFSLDIHQSLSDQQRESKRIDLSQIVNTVIIHDQSLFYYQGFHSFCSIFYQIGGLDLGFKMSFKASQTYLKDSMRQSFDNGVVVQILLVYKLLEELDWQLAQKIKSFYTFDGELTCPVFCLSWIITWLSHDLDSFQSVCRIFDFILGTHPLSPVYLTACIICSRKEEILEFQCMSELHQLFSAQVRNIEVEEICYKAYQLIKRISPDLLVEKSDRKFESEQVLNSSPVGDTELVENLKVLQRKEERVTFWLGTAMTIVSIYLFYQAGRN